MSEEIFFGTIRAFNFFKGFGFIRRNKGKDVFFFYSEVNGDDKNLVEGDSVSFLIKPMPKGPRAYNIHKVS